MKWIQAPRPPITEELISATGGNELIAGMLASRGMTGYEEARAFLDPKFFYPSSPEEMPGMKRAVEIIENAIKKGIKIGVWGDFDVDGQTATTLLVSGLKSLGANVIYHIPVRAFESHGVNIPNLSKLIDEGVQLIVTCDTGIGAYEAVMYAREKAVKFVITDHHDLPHQLPPADAIINSKCMPSGHPLSTLPGVGVAYKLIEKLFQDKGRSTELDKYLDLVALGIVADVAYQTGETRYLLQKGLSRLRRTERLGLKIMCQIAEIPISTLNEEDISYSLAPRLNSLGRLGDANVIVDFLTSDQESYVRVLAQRMEGLNAQRKLLSSQVFQAALFDLERDPSLLKYSAIVLAHQNWPAGILGIVANRLVERFSKPTVILAQDEQGLAKGSARSIHGCDISRAIAECDDLLEEYGGHPMAAGLAIKSPLINQFRKCISEKIDQQMGVGRFEPELIYDIPLHLSEVSLALVDQLDMIAPFGPGNPPLVFVSNNLRLISHSTLGRTAEHLRLIVEDEIGNQREVVWWQGSGWQLPQGIFDLAFAVRKNIFKDDVQVQMELLDFQIIEAEEEVVPEHKLEVIDCRMEVSKEKYLEKIFFNHRDAVLWAEAIELQKFKGQPRNKITPGEIFVIWHSPSSLNELLSIIEHVNPKTVYYFGMDPQLDQFQGFITRLAGLCKFVISTKGGETNLISLASAMAHTETIVRLGLEWLENSGNIQIVVEDSDSLKIDIPGENLLGFASPEITLNQIAPLLREARSFRKYLAECTSRQLENIFCGK